MEEKITPEIVSEICGYIRAGATFEIAAIAAGFKREDVETLNQLLLVAKDGIFKEFADDIKRAYAQFEVMQLMKINSEGGGKGAQWLLERLSYSFKKKPNESQKPKGLLQPAGSNDFIEYKYVEDDKINK